MIPFTVAPDGTAGAVGAYNVSGSVGGFFLWCSTARDRTSLTNDNNASSVRSSDTVYMRGLKETISLRTNSGETWRWRRIVFTTKDSAVRLTGVTGTAPVAIEASPNGWVRLLNNQSSNGTNTGLIYAFIFKGMGGVDWLNAMSAKTDSSRISVMYDKTVTLQSGNASGITRQYKRWHPMNKNLTYDNDENGEQETISYFSTAAKPGMGDCYVLDFFECNQQTSANILAFQPQATLYWHEK